jgi:hypothetical protein
MPEELSRLLQNGHETIVRDWTEKVTADRRINSDARLSYVQLIDHVPQIVEELREALKTDPPADAAMLEEGRNHGRQRWQQGYELKEVVRELTLLRATLMEFLDKYRAALPSHRPDQFSRFCHKINGFIDEEIYKTVEAYLEAPRHHMKGGGENFPANSNH